MGDIISGVGLGRFGGGCRPWAQTALMEVFGSNF